MSQYTKLYKSIITSSVWQESKETKLVWITLLALCEKDGTVNGAVPGLAHIAGVTIPECVRAIGDLEKPDPYSRTKEHEGRRIKTIEGGWLVLNKEKYTYEDADRRDYYKEYNAQRAQVRTSKHRVHTHKDKDKDKDEEEETNSVADATAIEFDKARRAFGGTKLGNKTEFTNFQRHNDWQECLPLLLPAVKREIEHRAELKQMQVQFIPQWKNFRTWINQRCWEQEFVETKEESFGPTDERIESIMDGIYGKSGNTKTE
jgi:hypothetical protein